MEDSKVGRLLFIDGGFLYDVGFKLLDKSSVHDSVRLGFWGFYGIGEDIQEVGHCNRTPWMRNKIFLKLLQELIGVVGM